MNLLMRMYCGSAELVPAHFVAGCVRSQAPDRQRAIMNSIPIIASNHHYPSTAWLVWNMDSMEPASGNKNNTAYHDVQK